VRKRRKRNSPGTVATRTAVRIHSDGLEALHWEVGHRMYRAVMAYSGDETLARRMQRESVTSSRGFWEIKPPALESFGQDRGIHWVHRAVGLSPSPVVWADA